MTKEYPYTTAALSPFRHRMDRMASALKLHRQSIQQLTVALARLEERVTVLTEENRHLRKHVTERDREIRDLQITSGILSSFTSSDG
jgi:chromosome segregation ATPase